MLAHRRPRLGARFPEALEMAEEGLAWIPAYVSGSAMGLGYQSPFRDVVFWRGFCLRLDGSVARGDRGLDSSPASRDGGWHAGDGRLCPVDCRGPLSRRRPGRGRCECARQLEEISRTLGEPAVLVASTHSPSVRRILPPGGVADAIEAARAALDATARATSKCRAAAALLAEALLQAGDLSAAVAAAQEAIALCRPLAARQLRSRRPMASWPARCCVATAPPRATPPMRRSPALPR